MDDRAGGGPPSGVQQNGSPSDGRHAHTPHTRMHTIPVEDDAPRVDDEVGLGESRGVFPVRKLPSPPAPPPAPPSPREPPMRAD